MSSIKINDVELRLLLAMAEDNPEAMKFKRIWAATRGPILEEFNRLLNASPRMPGTAETIANLMTLRLRNTP